jgi:hypothetical protein
LTRIVNARGVGFFVTSSVSSRNGTLDPAVVGGIDQDVDAAAGVDIIGDK